MYNLFHSILDSSKEMSFDEITVEHHLTHVKRPGGPKNRRKPGATERREKVELAIMFYFIIQKYI